jgi:hypothetical protein
MHENMSDLVGYEHPYGFVVIQSPNLGEGIVARIHVWERGSADEDYLVHDHVYDLRSFTVLGTISQMSYDLSIEPPFNAREYRASYGGGTSTITSTDRLVRLYPRRTISVTAGAGYSMAAGELHTVTVSPAARAATLAITQYRREARSPRVFGPIDGVRALTSRRRGVDSGRMRALMREVVETTESWS